MMNEFDERYAEKVFALHQEVGLDSRDDASTRLWHLLRTLLEYCDGQSPRIDFDAILQDVRDDFIET